MLIYYLSAIFIILIYFSALFSSTETALLSLRHSQIRGMVKAGKKNSEIIQKLKDDSHTTMVAILLGNNMVNILAASIATMMAYELVDGYTGPFFEDSALSIALSTGFTTLVILVFGEITPKGYAISKAEKVMQRNARFMRGFIFVFKPLIYLFDRLARGINSARGVKEKRITLTETELKAIVDISEEEGLIESSERDMIHNVLEFDETTVGEIMAPIAEVVALEESRSISEFLEMAAESNYSRIGVYRKHPENVVGVVHIKDALPYLKSWNKGIPVSKIMRNIDFVPSSKRINTLFTHFKTQKEHIAAVVNEYGNTLGIVTMEDVLEELVGDIMDESDVEQDERIQIVDENTVIARGCADIDDINLALKVKIEEFDSFDTIAGYIMHHLGRIPKRGFSEMIGPVKITVLDATHKRILKVKVEKGTGDEAKVLDAERKASRTA
jgi:CBS domain containing-hemolysin-like protein